MQPIEDPQLAALSVDLMNEIAHHGTSDNTQKKYNCYFQKWTAWTEKFAEVKDIPGEAKFIAIFMLSQMQSGSSHHVLSAIKSSISWVHKTAGLNDPCTSFLVSNILEASKRQSGKPTIKKEPITVEMLTKLTESLDNNNSLKDLRNVTLCVLGFAAFLRYDELSNITIGDISFKDHYFTISITSSKTDVYREGNTVVVAKTGNPTCPFSLLKQYLNALNPTQALSEDQFIFRGLSFKQGIFVARKANKKLSYTTVREIVLAQLKSIGLDPKLFGVHSLRSGGATAAANASVLDRNFKRHGRWKSESAKDGYIKDDLIHRLGVTMKLGL